MSITAKLFNVKNKVLANDRIKPQGTNEFHKYNYYKPSQILGLVNPLITEQNLFFEFIINGYETFPHKTNTSEKKTDGTVITRETESHDFIAQVQVLIHDMEAGKTETREIKIPIDKVTPQGYGAVLTYVERYFYLKTFGIATDDDDPDTDESKGTSAKKTTRPKL